MAQDYYDPLQVFDHIVKLIDDNKATLGLRYIAQLDEDLIPEYPAVLINMEGAIQRTLHATQMFRIAFGVDLWVFHAQLSASKAVRSRKDIELATEIRKLMHRDNNKSLDGHIVQGWVTGEYPGRTTRVVGDKASTIVTTRLTWYGENRVPFRNS
jgi:hypothetical protein